MHPVDPSRHLSPADQPARLDALEAAVRARTDLRPVAGVVLGSGLGGLADELADSVAIPFEDLPGWPAATAPGHVGRLLLGRIGATPVVMLQGRFHMYEGNDPGLVVQPVLLFQRLGARLVVLTNAAGGINRDFGPGTLMVISDHGFCNFRRGVNLNTWLKQEGYLVLKSGQETSGDWFAQVDWENCRPP